MPNIGEISEIVNASELRLDVGADTYILLKNLDITIGRTEHRDVTTDGGPLYSYGAGDNFFTATLLVSTPEITSLNTLTQIDGNGDMTSTAWRIVAEDISGATRTFQADGVLRDYTVKKPEEGKVEIDIFVRITGDTVTVS